MAAPALTPTMGQIIKVIDFLSPTLKVLIVGGLCRENLPAGNDAMHTLAMFNTTVAECGKSMELCHNTRPLHLAAFWVSSFFLLLMPCRCMMKSIKA